MAVTAELFHPAALAVGDSADVICGGVVSMRTATEAVLPSEPVTSITCDPLASPPGTNGPRYASDGPPSIEMRNVVEGAPETVICGGAENQPDAGATGDSVTVGAGGGGGVGAKPGPLFAAHETLPAPSTTWTITRICSLAIPVGTAKDPT